MEIGEVGPFRRKRRQARYGRQQIDRRGTRFVLPIQAKARIAQPFRAAFDYHCRLNMPADPIPPAARADCIF